MFSRLKKAAASAAKNVSDIASAPKHAELGTRVQVGAYNVTVEKALAEGTISRLGVLHPPCGARSPGCIARTRAEQPSPTCRLRGLKNETGA